MPHSHLKLLQAEDPEILRIVFCRDYVITYLLQESEEEESSSRWEEAGVRGPVYLVRRRGTPRYQLIVQDSASDMKLVDSLGIGWDLDPQENYLFFKTQHADDQVRGLWFEHDTDRRKLTSIVTTALLELGSDDGLEMDEIAEDWSEATIGEQPMCGVPLPAVDWLASGTTTLGAALVAKAEEFAEVFAPLRSHKTSAGPSWASLGGEVIKPRQVDPARASTLSLFSCVNGGIGGASNARELWTSDDQGLKTCDAMAFGMLSRTMTIGRTPVIPLAHGNEGL